MKTAKFVIVTPERMIFEDQVIQVTLPSSEGELTILADHMPLVVPLRAGELVIRQESGDLPLAISGGVLRVNEECITVLADTAERVEEIDIKRSEEAYKRAEELRAEKKMDSEEFAALSAKIDKELARVSVVKKWRKL